MKLVNNTCLIFFIGFFFCSASYAELPILPTNFTISQAIEQDIQNILNSTGNGTASIVQQLTDQLFEKKQLLYRDFEEGTNNEIQSLLSNVGEYNNEYATSWADPNSNFDNFQQRLRQLGNYRVAPLYQEVSELP